jgi:hypothetical protein
MSKPGKGYPLRPTEVEVALKLIAGGATVSAAADAIERSPGTLHNAFKDTYPEEYAHARERRRDRIRSERWDRAFDRKDKSSSWFLQHLSLEELPETQAAARQRFELEVGGTVEVKVEPDFGRILAGLEQVGLIRRADAGVVDAAAVEVLPARTD